MEDRHSITEVHHEAHLVLHEEEGETTLLKRSKAMGEGDALCGAEAGGRLVEEEEAGTGRQSAPELGEPLKAIR